MTALTKSSIVIEIEVPVSGIWTPAESEAGINEGRFEDAQIDSKIGWRRLELLEEKYAGKIQKSLADARERKS